MQILGLMGLMFMVQLNEIFTISPLGFKPFSNSRASSMSRTS